MASSVTRLLVVAGEALSPRLTAGLSARGWRVGTPESAALEAGPVAACLVRDPAALKAMRAESPGTPIVFLAERNSVSDALEALRLGAADVVADAVSPCRLHDVLDAATSPARGDSMALAFDIPVPLGFDAIAGSSPPFLATLASAAKSARSKSPILIEGEDGTGRSTIARAIHMASARAGKPFAAIDLSQTPAIEVESLLFGHEKGAFAGAFAKSKGLFREADGGTLYIKHPEYASAQVQELLVHALTTGEVRAIGARGFREVDVRVIAAAHAFRESSLFELLAATRIFVPPLRARRGDIAALTRHLVDRIGGFPGVRPMRITDAALTLLSTHDWPGNAAELLGALLRAVALGEGEMLDVADFPLIALQSISGIPESRPNGAGVTLFEQDGHLRPLDAIEADVIRLAIGHYRGRMSEVARRLRIGRSTLYRKLDDLGISDAA